MVAVRMKVLEGEMLPPGLEVLKIPTELNVTLNFSVVTIFQVNNREK